MAEPIFYFTKKQLLSEKRKIGKSYEKLLFLPNKTMVENLAMEKLRNKIVEIDKQIKELGEKR